MTYNLTDEEKDLLRWFVRAYQAGHIPNELGIMFGSRGLSVISIIEGVLFRVVEGAKDGWMSESVG